MKSRIFTATTALSAIIAGCTVGPDYKPPQVALPDQFSELSSASVPTTRSATRPATQPLSMDNLSADYERWWTNFGDDKLNDLILRSQATNLDVIAAEARIYEARASQGVAASAFYPQVNAQGGYTQSRTSPAANGFGNAFPITPETHIWQAGFDASWEIDVFGGTRRSVESANDSIQAAVEDRRDVLVSLYAEVAVNYIQLRGAQHELSIANRNLSSQQQTLALTRSKAEGGLIPYLNVAQQEAQVASTAAVIPSLEAQIRQNIHHLGVLLGQDPGALSDELTPEGPIPVGPPFVPPGVPSDLVRRRPDVRRAERQLAAQTAQIGVATADLFPKFSITGALGTESRTFNNLFDWGSRTYSIAPGVTWDIFDAGKVKSNIQVQTAKQAESLAAFKKAVLQSLQDVDDTLVAYNREQVRLQYLRDAVDANQKAVDLSQELFNKGSKDFLSVLDAQRDLFAAQDAMARSEQQVSANLIALYKALGGGWGDQK